MQIKEAEDRLSGSALAARPAGSFGTPVVLSRDLAALQYPIKRPFAVTDVSVVGVVLEAVVGPGVVWGQLVGRQSVRKNVNVLPVGTTVIGLFVLYAPLYAVGASGGDFFQSNILGVDATRTRIEFVDGPGSPSVDNSHIAAENRFARIATFRLVNGAWVADSFSGLTRNILLHPPNRVGTP